METGMESQERRVGERSEERGKEKEVRREG